MRSERGPDTHRTTVQWMGEPVLTLADVWPQRPRGVIVSLNSTPTSVAAGHYHQGSLAQRQLSRLADAGLFRAPEPGQTSFEDVAAEAGIGLADVVRRPTCAERHLIAREIEVGRRSLVVELEARRVALLICIFRRPVDVLLGTSGPPGFQPRTTSWGARVFRLPGPFAPVQEVRGVMAELTQALGSASSVQ
ncbi:hypothetical protein [Ornithinimicrobium pekingense]|uniref:Uncharacterized protein n=1 Tax=Ornithinimicrobium pekingense TaxID=384677 RepID=A0ABQ2F4T3_9MICO|nr:hypothetical protein [Ornithinimicrobium pekingense]GGK61106.1 hypothetical protein GCM10011509_06750 [Ornithinimicrobium pekingense]